MQISSNRFRALVTSVLLASAAFAPHARADADQHRLSYVFDSTIGEHAARLRQVEVLSRPFQDDLKVVAISRDLSPTRVVSVSHVILLASHEVLDTSRFARVLSWFDQTPGHSEDFLLLEDEKGHLVTASSGDMAGMMTLRRTLAATFRKQVATEVDFSTWGKVKELFR
jgi:hypothetical protein